MTRQQTFLVICFGVSGCGKSTLAQALAQRLGWHFVEADDFHSQQNKQHMASGRPLTDDMRNPWLARILEHLKESELAGRDTVLAFSGLRRQHRQALREQLGSELLFLHLRISRDQLAARLQQRKDHFMPASLMDSQFEALQDPSAETDVCQLEASQAVNDLLSSSLLVIQQHNP